MNGVEQKGSWPKMVNPPNFALSLLNRACSTFRAVVIYKSHHLVAEIDTILFIDATARMG